VNLFQYKFMYMHGRREFDKQMDEEDLNNIRANLRTGAVLFADACCGSKEFDRSFREFAKKLYPDRKLEPIKVRGYAAYDPAALAAIGTWLGL